MKNTRILWVTNAFGCGGAERQMLYMYDILQRYCNYDITILYYAKVGDELPTENVKTVFVNKAKIGKIKTIKEIAKYIKTNNISIMHAFGGCSANIYGRAGAALVKGAIPVGAMLGQKHFAGFNSKVINSFLNIFGNWWTVNNIELIPILQRDLRFTTKKHIKMIHNGYVPAIKTDFQIGNQTEFDDDKKDNFIFCAVGRLQPIKNYELYVRAANIICRKYQKVKFWIIGNGSEYQKLNSLISCLGLTDRIKMWGFRKDIDAALYRCDAFVQTSFTEGSPNTIAEALRASKPIISTKSTNLSEMIEENKNGYIVNNNDVEALSKSMEDLINLSDEKYDGFCKKSYDLFEKNFVDIKVAKEFDKFYSDLLS